MTPDITCPENPNAGHKIVPMANEQGTAPKAVAKGQKVFNSKEESQGITSSPAQSLHTERNGSLHAATSSTKRKDTELGRACATLAVKRPRKSKLNPTTVTIVKDASDFASNIKLPDDGNDDVNNNLESGDAAAREDDFDSDLADGDHEGDPESTHLPQASMIAKFDETDMRAAPGPPISEKSVGAGSSDAGLDGKTSMQVRIIKMLRLGLHPDTPEHEAKQSMKIANHLLTRYNISKVDMQQAAKEDCSPCLDYGAVKVRLFMRATENKVKLYNWIEVSC